MKLTLIAAALGVSLTLCAASYYTGVQHQKSAYALAQKEAQLKLFKDAEIISRRLAEKDAKLAELQIQLEEAALQDSNAARPAFGAASVRRINRAGNP